jgi:hypothetical protein
MNRPIVVVAGLAAALSASAAHGAVWVLQDLSATSRVDDSSQSGMFDWEVGGTDHLFQQWFWFRTSGMGSEASLDTLPISGVSFTDTNPFVDVREDTLSVQYQGNGFTINPSWRLRGDTTQSSVAEVIEITNTSQSTLNITFFQYSDFDLNGGSFDTYAEILAGNTAVQADGPNVMSETAATPSPSHWEVNTFPVILNSLNDGGVTNLSDASGPLTDGDFTWAFQWDIVLGVGDSFLISKNKLLTVPAPGAAALLAVAGLAGLRRRR